MSQIVDSYGETQSHSRNPSSSGLLNNLHRRTKDEHNIKLSQPIINDHEIILRQEQDNRRETLNKTTSPILKSHLLKQKHQSSQNLNSISVSRLQKHISQETRIRKFTKEVLAKREKFADIIVILGLNQTEFIDSYPSMKNPEVAKDHSYVENLQWICFPKKYIVQSYDKKKEIQLCKHKIFHFTVTNVDGNKKYITSLLFKELFLTQTKGTFLVPKSICIASSKPIFTLQKYLCEDIDNYIEIEEKRERKSQTVKHGSRQNNKISTTFFKYMNHKSYGFTLENYNFELLLQQIKPEKILQLITALLLERKIILVKKKFGDIALIMESLVSLLAPFKWNFVFITYLTPKLLDCLEAPFPYIIGVSRRVWEDQCIIRELPNDIIIYDIDNQVMTNYFREELPPLPEPQGTILSRVLKDLLDMKERFVEGLFDQQNTKISREKIDDYYWGYAQLRIKQGFLNFFLLTINNYIGYFKILDEEGDLSPQKKGKKVYDKMTSSDIFDFDAYLNQFEGKNREFMDKLTKTQSFSNFIEETYQNLSPKTPIGFFKTNWDPVKFNLGRMFKLYKQQLIQKNIDKIKIHSQQQEDTCLTEENMNNNIVLLPHNQQDFMSDALTKFLLEEVENNQSQQLSIINGLSQYLITDMPGIEYEQISTYKQLKSQRSEQSLERKLIEQRKMFGKEKGSEMLMMQYNIPQEDDEIEVKKSRNFNKIKSSRSGGEKASIDLSKNNYKHFLMMGESRKIPNGYVGAGGTLSQSEEDSYFFPQQQFANMTQDLALNKEGMSSGGFEIKDKAIREKKKIGKQQSNRVQSENSFIKNSYSVMNKTVIDNKNINVYDPSNKLAQMKSKVYKVDDSQENVRTNEEGMDSTFELQRKNNHTALIKVSQNIMVNEGIQQTIQTPVSQSQNWFYRTKQIQTNMRKNTETSADYKNKVIKQGNNQGMPTNLIKGTIALHRSKHGLQLKSDDRSKVNLSHQYIQSPNQTGFYKREQIHNNGVNNQNNNQVGQTLNSTLEGGAILSGKSGTSSQNMNKVGSRADIDLMNPLKKKQSRNEERKQAQKKGMLRFESHQSFYSFYSPKDEEFNKYLLPQKFNKELQILMMNDDSTNLGVQKNHNKRTYYQQQLLYQQQQLVLSGGEEDFQQVAMQSTNKNSKKQQVFHQQLQQQDTKNHINYKKRNQQQHQQQQSKMMKESSGRNNNNLTPSQLQQNQQELLTTNINFQTSYVKQKQAYNNQSPSVITNTENSALKKSGKYSNSDQQLLDLEGNGQTDSCMNVDSSPQIQVNKKIKEAINKTVLSSPKTLKQKKNGKFLGGADNSSKNAQFMSNSGKGSGLHTMNNVSMNMVEILREQKKQSFQISPPQQQQNDYKKEVIKTVQNDKKNVKKQQQAKIQKSQQVYEIDIEEQCSEDRPLLLNQESSKLSSQQYDLLGGQKSQIGGRGENQELNRHSESPQFNSLNGGGSSSQNNFTFKTFHHQQKKDKELVQASNTVKGQQKSSKKSATNIPIQTRSPQNQNKQTSINSQNNTFSSKVATGMSSVKKSPQNGVQKKNQMNLKQVSENIKNSQQTSNANTLFRKKSHEIGEVKSNNQVSTKNSNNKVITQSTTNNLKNNPQEQMNNSISKTKVSHYKQRPVQTSSSQQQQQQQQISKYGVSNIQLDLEHKEKLTTMLTSDSIILQQNTLRISPIPPELSQDRNRERIVKEEMKHQISKKQLQILSLPSQQESNYRMSPTHNIEQISVNRKESLTKIKSFSTVNQQQQNSKYMNKKSMFNYNSTSNLIQQQRNSDKVIQNKRFSRISSGGDQDQSKFNEDMFGKNKPSFFEKKLHFPASTKNSIIPSKRNFSNNRIGSHSNQQSFRSSTITNNNQMNDQMRNSDMVVIDSKKGYNTGESGGDQQQVQIDYKNHFYEQQLYSNELSQTRQVKASDYNSLCNYNSQAQQDDNIVPQINDLGVGGQNDIGSVFRNSPKFITGQSYQQQQQLRPPQPTIKSLKDNHQRGNNTNNMHSNFFIGKQNANQESISLQSSLDLNSINAFMLKQSRSQNKEQNNNNLPSQTIQMFNNGQKSPSPIPQMNFQVKHVLVGLYEDELNYKASISSSLVGGKEGFIEEEEHNVIENIVSVTASSQQYQFEEKNKRILSTNMRDRGISYQNKLSSAQSPQSSMIISSNKYMKNLQGKGESDKKNLKQQNINNKERTSVVPTSSSNNQSASSKFNQQSKAVQSSIKQRRSQDKIIVDDIYSDSLQQEGVILKDRKKVIAQQQLQGKEQQLLLGGSGSQQRLNLKNDGLSKSTKNLYNSSSKDLFKGKNLVLPPPSSQIKQNQYDSIIQLDADQECAHKSKKNSQREKLEQVVLLSNKNSSSSMHSTPKNNDFHNSKFFKTSGQLQQQLQSNMISLQKEDTFPLPTIRTNGMPIKKIGYQYSGEGDLSNQGIESFKQREIDDITYDLPLQMPSKQIKGGEEQKEIEDQFSKKERASKLIQEFEQLLELKPNNYKSNAQVRLSKGQKEIQKPKQKQFLREYQDEDQRQSYATSKIQLPLNEIKFPSNEQNIDIIKGLKVDTSKSSDLINNAGIIRQHKHQTSESSFIYNHQSKLQREGVNQYKYSNEQVSSQNGNYKSNGSYNSSKRSLRPHGQTTCVVLPSKESMEYIKKDLNQDVFCKINSHLGDTDKDPHTPKSQGSPKSTEKFKRQYQQIEKQQFYFQPEMMEVQEMQIPFKQHVEQPPYPNKVLRSRDEEINTPSRNSSSMDAIGNNEKNQREFKEAVFGFEVAPIQRQRRIESGYQEMQFQKTQQFNVNAERTGGQSDQLIKQANDKFQEEELLNFENVRIKRVQNNKQGLLEQSGKFQVRQLNSSKEVQYEVLFEDSDLKDTDDKFTSRDANFSRLKVQRVSDQY